MNESVENVVEWVVMAVCIVPGVILSFFLSLLPGIRGNEDKTLLHSKIFWVLSILSLSFVSWLPAIMLACFILVCFLRYEEM